MFLSWGLDLGDRGSVAQRIELVMFLTPLALFCEPSPRLARLSGQSLAALPL
jgi:hypothetical protein